jgi:hypothetical protein
VIATAGLLDNFTNNVHLYHLKGHTRVSNVAVARASLWLVGVDKAHSLVNEARNTNMALLGPATRARDSRA